MEDAMKPLVKTTSPSPGGTVIPILVAQARYGQTAYSIEHINDANISSVLMDIRVLDGDYEHNNNKRMYLRITAGADSTAPVEIMVNCLIFLRDGRILPCMNEIRDFYNAGWRWQTTPANNGSDALSQ